MNKNTPFFYEVPFKKFFYTKHILNFKMHQFVNDVKNKLGEMIIALMKGA